MTYLSDNTTINLCNLENDKQTNDKERNSPILVELSLENCAGHADHWCLLSNDVATDIPQWLQNMVATAKVPHGLLDKEANLHNIEQENNVFMALSGDADIHINQILTIKDNKPSKLLNAFPCVNSPYGVTARIEQMIVCRETQDAVLRLKSNDGSVIYAFDQMYTTNQKLYQANSEYFVNLSAWVYRIKPSDGDQVIVIEDQPTIRYHRAYNDIVANNKGIIPENLDELIEQWQPENVADKDNLAPIEISMANMCAYLFGETLGQEDDAWCQGEVIGKQATTFEGIDITLFDVVILREPDVKPLVVRMAAVTTTEIDAIKVTDFIQANLWMQAAIYKENQDV